MGDEEYSMRPYAISLKEFNKFVTALVKHKFMKIYGNGILDIQIIVAGT